MRATDLQKDVLSTAGVAGAAAVGKAQVEQLANALVARRSVGDHVVDDLRELDERGLTGERECSVLESQLRGHAE